MIVYFSATGNSEYVAKKVAEATGDTAVSITKVKEQLIANNGEVLGIVTPVYFWGLPSYVEEWLQNISIQVAENTYVYLIATYGGTCGQVDGFLKKILRTKGIALSASFGIKTVDNWTVWYDANDKQKIAKTLQEEGAQLARVIAQVKEQQRVFIKKHKKSMFMSRPARYFYQRGRKTSHLAVEDSCIGCGLCQTNCPEGAIQLVDGKPTWIKKRCTMCFRCLHHCPAFAIQYNGKTKDHGQYIHP